MSPENQAEYFVTNGNPAASIKAYDDPDVQKAFPMYDVIRDSLDQAAPRPQTPFYNEVSTGLQQTWYPPASVDPDTTPQESTEFHHRRPARGATPVNAGPPTEPAPRGRHATTPSTATDDAPPRGGAAPGRGRGARRTPPPRPRAATARGPRPASAGTSPDRRSSSCSP